MRLRLLGWTGLFMLAACGPSASDYVDADIGGGGRDGGGGPGEFVDAGPAEACEKMDILFVIDDSGSMSEEQGNLAMNFPDFITLINDYMTEAGDVLDYRVAITTTGRDVKWTIDLGVGFPIPFDESGANGEFLTGSGCGYTKKWLERTDPDVSGAFSCVAAALGTSGPSYEMPLLATELAFTDRVSDGTNMGFLREDALLAIVILTDEDDCSREDNDFTATSDSCNPPLPETVPLAQYLSFFDTLKSERGRWAMAVIAGPGPGTCTSGFGEAFEAHRLKQFVTDVGETAVFSSICDGDLTASLASALATFEAACDSFPPIP